MSKLFNDYFEVTVNRPHGGRPSFEINLCGFAISSDDIMAGNGAAALAAQLGKISAALRAAEALLGKPLSMDSLTALESALMAIGGSEEDDEGIDLSMIDSAVAIAENWEAKEAKKVQLEIEAMKTKQENDKRDEAEFNESQQAQKTRAVLEVVADVISDKQETIHGVLVPLSVIIELEARYRKLKQSDEVEALEEIVQNARSKIDIQTAFMERHPSNNGHQQRVMAHLFNDLGEAMNELADLKAQ